MASTKGRARPSYDRVAMGEQLLARLTSGDSLADACKALGVRRVTVWRWTKADPEFAERFEQAHTTGLLTGRRALSIPPLEIAYAAGFFDGEGCARIARGPLQKNGRRYFIPFVQLTNTNVSIVQFFHDRWPGYWEKDVANGKNPNAKHYSSWKLSGLAAEQFLRDVYPHLRVKREHAELIFEFRQFVGNGRRTRDRSEAEYQHLLQFHSRSRHLNARGVGPVVVRTD